MRPAPRLSLYPATRYYISRGGGEFALNEAGSQAQPVSCMGSRCPSGAQLRASGRHVHVNWPSHPDEAFTAEMRTPLSIRRRSASTTTEEKTMICLNLKIRRIGIAYVSGHKFTENAYLTYAITCSFNNEICQFGISIIVINIF